MVHAVISLVGDKKQIIHVLQNYKSKSSQTPQPRKGGCNCHGILQVIDQHREPGTKIVRALIPTKIQAVVSKELAVNFKLKPQGPFAGNGHMMIPIHDIKAEEAACLPHQQIM